MIWTEERKELARAAVNRWHGTPHKNRMAIHGVGIDCIQFVYEVLFSSGILPRVVVRAYNVDDGMWKESTKLREIIMRCMNAEEATGPREFGDILIFKTGNRSAHCGIIIDGNLWHALGHRSVTKSDLRLWERDFKESLRIIKEGFKVRPDCISLR